MKVRERGPEAAVLVKWGYGYTSRIVDEEARIGNAVLRSPPRACFEDGLSFGFKFQISNFKIKILICCNGFFVD